MLLTKIVRGNSVEVSTAFNDAAGDPVSPDSAALTVSYMNLDDVRDIEIIEMNENTDGSFVAVWDSSIASNGRVHWSARGVNPSAAVDGQFELTANLANPDPGTV